MKTTVCFFAAIGLLALGYWMFEFFGARSYQARETKLFARSSPPQVKEPSYPTPGSAVAILAIPRLGLTSIVVEGAEEPQLRLAPGHIRGTSFPGEGGNIGIAGHRDTFFRPLRFARKNDTITVTTRSKEYLYKVVSMTIVSPNDISVLYPQNRETLTLVTCYPFNYVGSAPKRFVVKAEVSVENDPCRTVSSPRVSRPSQASEDTGKLHLESSLL
jgi:LPXTG-site transpeptidase (sortase) family protein